MYGTLRIDYILYSEGMTAQKYMVDSDVILSDHLPVMATIKLGAKK
jgi:endonuclease/exonuclease/phosphatase family metal-dependent hydrolase